MSKTQGVLERLISGDRTALARAITWAESGDARFREVLTGANDRVGRGWRVGITGPPGAGKSTLTNELVNAHREAERTVGVVAVDPSSPFTGGALLGDRIRMDGRIADEGVFIRSMATRGSHGGIARATVDAVDAMDAFGFDELLIETVGVGQAEYDVVGAADTVLVVLCPGAGDGVQALKSGILEVADVLCVNKADLKGADRLVADLEEAVELRSSDLHPGWTTPVVACSAGKSEGIEGVLAALTTHREWLEDGRLADHRESRRLAQVRRAVSEAVNLELWEEAGWGARATHLLGLGEPHYDVVAGLIKELRALAREATGGGTTET
jgi:LAO/AO transport system kinase